MFWPLVFGYWSVSVFLLVSVTHIHILSPLLEKQSAWFLFEGDYETEQIHSLSYQGSFCVISGPGVNLMAVVMFDTAKLRYLCISPGQWSLIGSLPFLLCYWDGRVEVVFIPWGFSWILRIVFSLSNFCSDWKSLWPLLRFFFSLDWWAKPVHFTEHLLCARHCSYYSNKQGRPGTYSCWWIYCLVRERL